VSNVISVWFVVSALDGLHWIFRDELGILAHSPGSLKHSLFAAIWLYGAAESA
jgi:hypothetical protein